VTKEHFLARSLTKLFVPDGSDAVIRHDYEHPELGIVREPKRAKTIAHKARKYCGSCNSGWMNEADQVVRPVLESFAANRSTTLAPVEQQQLAFWATKAVFGFLSIEPEGYRFAPPELYHELYQTRRPLTGSQVWVGGNTNGQVAWYRAHSLIFRDLGDLHGFGASLSFGFGVLHFMYHGSDERLLRLRYDAHRSLRQIWPVQQGVVWPPPLLMEERDLTPLPHIINAKLQFRSASSECEAFRWLRVGDAISRRRHVLTLLSAR
jgi:hypothetical protein